MKYYYQSRTTYNGQFTGKHTLGNTDKLDWSAGYSYANRNMPDRRRYTTVLNEETNQLEVRELDEPKFGRFFLIEWALYLVG